MILLGIALGVLACFGFVVLFGAPYVPTLSTELRSAFIDLYELKKNDVVVDLGSGDGRVLREATKHGAKGYGYELNPLLVLLSRVRLGRRATIQLRDMWSVTLPADTTLVYVFTVSRDTKRLSRFLQKQADARGQAIHVMTFGPTFAHRQPVASLRGHSLYEIQPMQQRSA
jgi:hypothetical protein